MPNRVLLVDCDAAASLVTAHLLTTAGYLLDVAQSFEEAIHQVARQCPDLLLTAVRLGQFNGLHVALRCRALHPSLPIIVTGDQSEAGLAAEVEQYGFGFIDKTADPLLLLTLMGQLLGGAATA